MGREIEDAPLLEKLRRGLGDRSQGLGRSICSLSLLLVWVKNKNGGGIECRQLLVVAIERGDGIAGVGANCRTNTEEGFWMLFRCLLLLWSVEEGSRERIVE